MSRPGPNSGGSAIPPINHTVVSMPTQPPTPPQAPPPPVLPRQDLFQGSRENYVKYGVPLYEASIEGDWEAAEVILKEKPELICSAITENGETPLHIAASAESSKDVEKFVENLVSQMDEKDLELQDKYYNTALSLAAAAGNVKTAMIMVKKNKNVLELPGHKNTMPLYMAALFAKPEMVRYLYDNSKKMVGDYWTHENRGWVLQKCVEAEIFVELIKSYPDLIWNQDEKGQSIFHVAVKRRHEKIYNLLYEIGARKDLITTVKDREGNNMLHLVAKSDKPERYQKVSAVALQIQRELLWFRDVELMIQPSYRLQKNSNGDIPHDLFTKNHEKMVAKGEEWVKDTASQCMVVAALIATIVFAAAFTLPGSYDQDTGIPFFRQKPSLIVFVISDAVSLIFSSTSVLIFLAILTARYAQRDFLESLPKKLMYGLASLFLSVVTMMVAFSASFFVLYHKNLKWVPITVAGMAGIPVVLFAILQFRLLRDVFKSTFQSRYLQAQEAFTLLEIIKSL